MGEGAPMMGERRFLGRKSGGTAVFFLAASAALFLCLFAWSSGAGGSAILLGRQMLVLGEPYPYIRSPYSDINRPYGYMSPMQYPEYVYHPGDTYEQARLQYDAAGKGHSKNLDNRMSNFGVDHEWFPDAYNVGTGPLSPLWTAMGLKQQQAQLAALRQTRVFQSLHSDRGQRSGTAWGSTDGQYESPILPTEKESPAWSLWGDMWQDHTYQPARPAYVGGRSPIDHTDNYMSGIGHTERQHKIDTTEQGCVGPACDQFGKKARNPGFRLLQGQKLYEAFDTLAGSSAAVASGKIFPTLKSEEGEPTAKPEWHTRGHSNNYMGMTAPIRNTNVLGDHQVGFSDKQVEPAEDAERAQSHVVDNALRGMWDVFAGNKAVTNFEVPKVASSLDTHVLCEEENDPSLCSVDALHPVRPEHISLRTIPVWKTNVNLNKGILASDSSGPTRGVLPAGGGLITYRYVSGGDAIRDCKDPAGCHLPTQNNGALNGPFPSAVAPYGLSRIPKGHNRGVDLQPIFTRPPDLRTAAVPIPLERYITDPGLLTGSRGSRIPANRDEEANAGGDASPNKAPDEPEWLRDLRVQGGYTGP